jgi:hypothetical protein
VAQEVVRYRNRREAWGAWFIAFFMIVWLIGYPMYEFAPRPVRTGLRSPGSRFPQVIRRIAGHAERRRKAGCGLDLVRSRGVVRSATAPASVLTLEGRCGGCRRMSANRACRSVSANGGDRWMGTP